MTSNAAHSLVKQCFPSTSPTPDVEVPVHSDQDIVCGDRGRLHELAFVICLSFSVIQVPNPNEWVPFGGIEQCRIERVAVDNISQYLDWLHVPMLGHLTQPIDSAVFVSRVPEKAHALSPAIIVRMPSVTPLRSRSISASSRGGLNT